MPVEKKNAPFPRSSSSLCLSVINPRFGIDFGLELFQFIFSNEFGDLAVGVLKVSKHSNSCHTGCNAGRCSPSLNQFNAESTFFNVASVFLDNSHVIRTGSDTILATNAFILIDQHHPVCSLIGGACGADLHTGRIITVLALNGQKFTVVIWKSSILPLLQMVVSFVWFEAVLILTRDAACIASHTFRFVNNHSVS